jgi:hypothetical protein
MIAVKIVRGIGLALLIVIGAVVVLALGVLGINLFDERLTPAATALLTSPTNPYTPGENLYVAMTGLQAPAGQSAIETGRLWTEDLDRRVQQSLSDPAQFGLVIQPKTPSLEFQGDISSCCPADMSLWVSAKDHRSQIAALTRANDELYRRYLELHSVHGYFQPDRIADYSPLPIVPQPLQTLYRANIAARIQQGPPEQARVALDDLAADESMWRTVMRGHTRYVGTLLAALSLRSDFRLLGALVADPQTRLESLGDDLPKQLAPWILEDWKIGRVHDMEMLARSPMIRSLAYLDSKWSPPNASWWTRESNALGAKLFKLNATLNLYAEDTLQLRDLSDGDARTFMERRERYRAWREVHLSRASLRMVYNPVGRILMSVRGGEEDFALRIYDVAAFQRLVYLAYQLRLQHIETAEVLTFMARHPEWATHPVSGAPFQWNAADATLAVIPIGSASKPELFKLKLAWLGDLR